MQVHCLLTKTMDIEEVVKTTYDVVCSHSLASSVRNLPAFTMYSKHRALSGGQKEDRPWLKWITGEVNLLYVIKE